MSNSDNEHSNSGYESELEHESESSEYESELEHASDSEDLEDETKKNKNIVPINNTLSIDDIKHLAFEKIKGNYYFAKYGDFKIPMDIRNGYMNATYLCNSANLTTKKFGRWNRTQGSRDFINELAEELDVKSRDLMIENKGGRNAFTRGTYVHPDLLMEIARWISIDFRLKCNKIVQTHFAKQVIAEKEAIIGQKDDKIARLEKMIADFRKSADKKMDKMIESNEELKERTKKIQADNEDLKEDNKELKCDAKKLLRLNKDTNRKLTTVVKDRVKHTDNENDKTHLVLIANNPRRDSQWEYYVLRTMKSNVNAGIKRHKNTHPDMEVILRIDYSPNAIVLWKNIKNYLKHKKYITASSCSFDLIRDIDNDRLVEIFNRVHDGRLKTDDL